MFKQIISVLALSTLAIAPASAELRRINSEDYYSAVDANNDTHYIEYMRMDHEGDVQTSCDYATERLVCITG